MTILFNFHIEFNSVQFKLTFGSGVDQMHTDSDDERGEKQNDDEEPGQLSLIDFRGIGRFSAEGFALCAYTVPVSAECFGKTTFCLTKRFVQQPDNFAPGNFLVWSTYWSITSQNLLWSARISFMRYVHRRFWKFLEVLCTPRARARLQITVQFCAKQSAILWL